MPHQRLKVRKVFSIMGRQEYKKLSNFLFSFRLNFGGMTISIPLFLAIWQYHLYCRHNRRLKYQFFISFIKVKATLQSTFVPLVTIILITLFWHLWPSGLSNWVPFCSTNTLVAIFCDSGVHMNFYVTWIYHQDAFFF